MTVALEAYCRKPWTEQDRRHLMVAYRSGASLKMMSDLFGRSTTAINKALTRYGARPLGSQPRGVRPRAVKRPVTTKSVQEKIHEYEASLDFVENETEEVVFSPEAVRAFDALKSQDLSVRKGNTLSKWVTKQEFLDYLLRKNFPVKIKKVGYHERYFLPNGKIYTLSGLLVFANKSRVEGKKPPFFLEEVTEG